MRNTVVVATITNAHYLRPGECAHAPSPIGGSILIVRKPVSNRTLKSDLAKVDAHSIRAHEYKELPDLTEKALSRAVVNKGGRPRATNPRKLISIRLPVDVIERWKATGPGWQTRIAERLSKVR